MTSDEDDDLPTYFSRLYEDAAKEHEWTPAEIEQSITFDRLYDRAVEVLAPFGVEDIHGDYSVGGDLFNHPELAIMLFSAKMLRSEVINSLQVLLKEFPGWEILLSYIPTDAPDMQLRIRANEIIDGLLRQYLPDEYRNIEYPGARAGEPLDYPPVVFGSLYPVTGKKRSSEEAAEEHRTFLRLYERTRELLRRFGSPDGLPGRREGDYTVPGRRAAEPVLVISFNSYHMLKPEVVSALQMLLLEFPGWEMLVDFCRHDGEGFDPLRPMGLRIRSNEIVDSLRREKLPQEYQSLAYPGARKGNPYR